MSSWSCTACLSMGGGKSSAAQATVGTASAQDAAIATPNDLMESLPVGDYEETPGSTTPCRQPSVRTEWAIAQPLLNPACRADRQPARRRCRRAADRSPGGS